MNGRNSEIQPGAAAFNILSFEVEDRFHDYQGADKIKDKRSRILPVLIHLLDLLDNQKSRATFFILGCVAEQFPEIVALVDARGHEVASHGYSSAYIRSSPTADLDEELTRSGEIIGDILGKKTLGFKPHQEHNRQVEPIMIERAAVAGYRYVSGTLRGAFSGRPFSAGTAGGSIEIFPRAAWKTWGIEIEFGERVRIYPAWFVHKAIQRLNRSRRPAVINLKLWELDRNQLRPPGSDYTNYSRYGNLNLAEMKLAALLQDFEFRSFEDWLGLRQARTPAQHDDDEFLR